MANTLVDTITSKLYHHVNKHPVILCEAPHGVGKASAAVRFAFNQLTVLHEGGEPFTPDDCKVLVVCPTASLALRVFQKLNAVKNPTHITGTLLLPEFLASGRSLTLSNVVILVGDFAAQFFDGVDQLAKLHLVVLINCFYTCGLTFLKAVRKHAGACPELACVVGTCSKFQHGTIRLCLEVFSTLVGRHRADSVSHHLFQPLGYEPRAKHSFFNSMRHSPYRTISAILRATYWYYHQIIVLTRSQDTAERIYVEISAAGLASELAADIRQVTDPLLVTLRERFGHGQVKLVIASFRHGLVRFARRDAKNLVIFFDVPLNKAIYQQHTQIYGAYRVITLVTRPDQQDKIASFTRRLTQYLL